eukprot:9437118-Pyramimonas_sp.AAC.1
MNIWGRPPLGRCECGGCTRPSPPPYGPPRRTATSRWGSGAGPESGSCAATWCARAARQADC